MDAQKGTVLLSAFVISLAAAPWPFPFRLGFAAPPRTRRDATTTSVTVLGLPSRSSNRRVWRRPSTNTCFPLVTNLSAISANLPQATQRTHSTRWTFPSFLSRKDWLMASEKFETDLPADVDLISASCPAFPRRITLFTPMLDIIFLSISNL